MFYTPATAAEFGLEGHGERCHDCPVFDRCDYRLDLETDDSLREMYLEAEDADGYYRDKCVWASDITIEDTMQVQATYANGVFLNYTLCAYSPWEGLEITFHGSKGELRHKHIEVHGVFGGRRDRAIGDNMTTTLHLAGKLPESIPVWSGSGDHGGADPVMLGYLFEPGSMPPDKYNPRLVAAGRCLVDPHRHRRQRLHRRRRPGRCRQDAGRCGDCAGAVIQSGPSPARRGKVSRSDERGRPQHRVQSRPPPPASLVPSPAARERIPD